MAEFESVAAKEEHISSILNGYGFIEKEELLQNPCRQWFIAVKVSAHCFMFLPSVTM